MNMSIKNEIINLIMRLFGKAYWKKGYFYVKKRVVCGICVRDLGPSSKRIGELGYCGCEEDSY